MIVCRCQSSLLKELLSLADLRLKEWLGTRMATPKWAPTLCESPTFRWRQALGESHIQVTLQLNELGGQEDGSAPQTSERMPWQGAGCTVIQASPLLVSLWRVYGIVLMCMICFGFRGVCTQVRLALCVCGLWIL